MHATLTNYVFIFPLWLFQHDQLRSANEDLLARVETLQHNAKLLEAQILDIQKAKAKADKELEAEKLLKEQKTKVVSVEMVHKLKHCFQWIWLLLDHCKL